MHGTLAFSALLAKQVIKPPPENGAAGRLLRRADQIRTEQVEDVVELYLSQFLAVALLASTKPEAHGVDVTFVDV